MKFLKTFFFFCLFAAIAISVRLAVFGSGEAPKALETQSVASDEAVSPSPSVSLPDTESPSESVRDAASPSEAVPFSEKPVLFVIGYVKRGQAINLWLSDGRFLTERDRELTEVRKNYAIIDGERVWFVRPGPGRTRETPTGFQLDKPGLPVSGSEAERSAAL